MTKRTRKLLGAIAVTAALLGGSVAAVSVANAAADICEQYGSVQQGKYVVMNNKWNPAAGGTQCIEPTGNGFIIKSQPNTAPTNGAPNSYPAIYSGCHYTNCSSDGHFPKQVSSIGSINSSIGFKHVGGAAYNASYDIWLDPAAKKDGVSSTEIMIWFARMGGIQPIGAKTGSANLGGRTWEVWTGSNGLNNVVSYVVGAGEQNDGATFNTLDFILDAFKQGSHYGNTSWYLTSIQAGFEPWSGGAGLAVTNFSVDVTGGSPQNNPPQNNPPQNNPPQNNPPQNNPPQNNPPQTSGGCSATFKLAGSWGSGFQGEIVVNNTGSGSLNGWTVKWSGDQVQQSWNTSISSSGNSHTAKPVGWNGNIGGGGSTSFGFIGNGSGSGINPTCSAG